MKTPEEILNEICNKNDAEKQRPLSTIYDDSAEGITRMYFNLDVVLKAMEEYAAQGCNKTSK